MLLEPKPHILRLAAGLGPQRGHRDRDTAEVHSCWKQRHICAEFTYFLPCGTWQQSLGLSKKSASFEDQRHLTPLSFPSLGHLLP